MKNNKVQRYENIIAKLVDEKEKLLNENKSLKQQLSGCQRRISNLLIQLNCPTSMAKAIAKPVKKKKKKDENEEDWKQWYNRMLETPQWSNKRLQIFKRDKHTCQLCGSKTNLQVHHLRYNETRTAPWAYPNTSLITLCEACHKKVHADPDHIMNPKAVPSQAPLENNTSPSD